MNWQNRPLWLEDLESRRLLASVNMPQDLTGAVGAQVSVPVLIDTAAGVRGAEIRIQYDPLVLSLNSGSITAGSTWEGDETQVVANVNQATGSVVVFVSAAEELPNVSGSLLIFNFGVLASASVGATTVVDFVSMSLNEGAITVTPAPVPGPDPSDGRITIVAGPIDPEEPGDADRITGFVFADTNNNNIPDSLEGIPGVTITLINNATGTTTQAVTDNTGFYEFNELVAGSYRIVQTQPLAYLDGGPNELNVQLAEEQGLENQNFRELGLRPEFVYNRFHTTLVQPVGSPEWISLLQRVNQDATNNFNAQASSSTSALVASANFTPTQESLVAEGESPESMNVPASLHVNGSFHSRVMAIGRSDNPVLHANDRTYNSDTHTFDDWAIHDVIAEGEATSSSTDFIAIGARSFPAPMPQFTKSQEVGTDHWWEALDQVFADFD